MPKLAHKSSVSQAVRGRYVRSAVGAKGKKRGQIGKISASEACRAVAWGGGKGHPFPYPDYLSARFARQGFLGPRQFYSHFPPNTEPGPRLQVCVSVLFFSDHCIKQIDSMLTLVCSVNRCS